ncbi:MAG TPA: hypothetical protein VGL38_04445 [bacterium]
MAQDVSIYDIQFTTNPSGTSPDSGLTVSTGGFVTGINYSSNSLYYFLSDRAGGRWHGILVRDNQDRHLAIGDSVHLSAQVFESSGQTRLQNIVTWDSVHAGVAVPTAVITCAILSDSTTLSRESTEGVLVELQNVTVASVNGSDFTVTDGSGTAVITSYGWTHAMPITGDSILYVRGLVSSTPNGFRINPRNDFDLIYTSNRPPVISQVRNMPAAPSSLESDTVTARITDETVVADARVYYLFGTTGDYLPLSMFDDGMHGDGAMGDNVWGAIIPQGTPRSTCHYYIWATDDSGRFSTSPPSAPQTTYSFVVSPTMADIYNHYADFDNATITMNGVVNFVEDVTTSSGSRRISAYMQDESGRGFYLSQSGAASTYPGIVRGNRISVRGVVQIYAGAVQMGGFTAADITVMASGVPMPAPIELKTGDRHTQREIIRTSAAGAYGTGTWCKLTGTVYRVDENVGGGTNIAIDDGTGSTTVRVWDSMNIDSVQLDGAWHPLHDLAGKFVSIYGPSSSYNGDFQLLGGGDVSDFETPGSGTPAQGLSLDIPNRPFAPEIGQTLKISYNAPALGQVRVRIFDLRGRLVRTLVDKLSGGPNVIQWDGRNELNELLPIGTYIVHLESVQSGNSKTKVKPIVVGTKL